MYPTGDYGTHRALLRSQLPLLRTAGTFYADAATCVVLAFRDMRILYTVNSLARIWAARVALRCIRPCAAVMTWNTGCLSSPFGWSYLRVGCVGCVKVHLNYLLAAFFAIPNTVGLCQSMFIKVILRRRHLSFGQSSNLTDWHHAEESVIEQNFKNSFIAPSANCRKRCWKRVSARWICEESTVSW